MNFSFDSVKLSSKLRNEDVCLDIETPRGHFFAVLDFGSHDYANLNVTLKGKLESLVGSFASLSDFSDDLFLGFVAKETNNFVSNLAEQSGDPAILFSAAFCLVSGDRLSYFLCGEIRIILSGDSLTAPQAAASETQLGESKLEAPMTDQVRAVTLHDDDLVLIMTQGLAEVLPADVASFRGSDPKSICDSLMKSSQAGGEDRTLVVIGGPFGQHVDAALPNLTELADFKQSLTSLEARLDALTGSERGKESDGDRLAGNNAADLSQQMESLKDDLRSKAASIDLLEFDEKIKALNALLAGKADRADVLGLQRDVLKLGLTSGSLVSGDANELAEATPLSVTGGDTSAPVIPSESPAGQDTVPQGSGDSAPALQPTPWLTSFNIKAALIVVAISVAAGFVGGWLHSGVAKSPEVWSVKTSGKQIVISRLDGPASGDVTMNMAEPAKATGEQRFSSFADVRQYIDTITSTEVSYVQTNQTSPASPTSQATPSPESKTPEAVREATIKRGDTLQNLSQAYRVPPEKLKELNPTISRWPAIRIGQKIFVPAAGPTGVTSLKPQTEPSPANQRPANTTAASPTPVSATPANTNPANTVEVRVGLGDSLNRLARRRNTTPERLKELNPQITNWLRLQIGQKVVVPAPPGG